MMVTTTKSRANDCWDNSVGEEEDDDDVDVDNDDDQKGMVAVQSVIVLVQPRFEKASEDEKEPPLWVVAVVNTTLCVGTPRRADVRLGRQRRADRVEAFGWRGDCGCSRYSNNDPLQYQNVVAL